MKGGGLRDILEPSQNLRLIVVDDMVNAYFSEHKQEICRIIAPWNIPNAATRQWSKDFKKQRPMRHRYVVPAPLAELF